MVRKSELRDAVWQEVDSEDIPKARKKRGKSHNVYLSRQSLDIMIALAGSGVAARQERAPV